MAYDFKTLNDKEFEQLVADLLSRHLSVRIERFRPGKDKGVDGRFFASSGKETIIQCKHWARSSVSALHRYLAQVEKPKIDRLKPSRYILAASLELSRQNKVDLAAAVSPWISSPSDIFGIEDLNDLLSRFADVEQRHYKLWLSSTGVLRTILNAAILGRSEFTLEELRTDATRYVRTVNHAAAQAKLDNLHVVLITGEPGIGKTTLAGQLCLQYVVERGFQLCVIADSIEEAEDILEPRTNQIFYFDDFLGRNYLAALDRHEDTHIFGFIRRISQDNSKRFILTSRTTILNQGKGLSDLFRIHNVDRNEYEIRVDSLTELDRAQILYNHIWYSQLGQSYVEQILSEKRYRKVIGHNNFNPRLISFVTDVHKVAEVGPAEYWGYIERTLTNPADIWEHVYNNQLDDYGRAALLLVVYNGGSMDEVALKRAYEALLGLPVSARYGGVRDFRATSARLVGAVLNRTVVRDGPATYSLFNPSVADYVLRHTASDATLLSALFSALSSERSLLNLAPLIRSGVLHATTAQKVLSQLAEESFQESKDVGASYGAILADLTLTYAGQVPTATERVVAFVNSFDVEDAVQHWEQLASVLDKCLAAGHTTPERALAIVRECEWASLDHDDFVALCNMRERIDGVPGQQVEDVLRPLIVSYWEDAIEQDIRENGILSDLYDEEEVADGERLVEETVDGILSEYGIRFDPGDVAKIVRCVDVVSEIESNRERAQGEDDDSGWRGGGMSVDAVDDLFESDGPMGGRAAK